MKLKTAEHILLSIGVLLMISLFIGSVALCIVFSVGGAIFWFSFGRCPNCGKYLGGAYDKYCPHCGEELE